MRQKRPYEFVSVHVVTVPVLVVDMSMDRYPMVVPVDTCIVLQHRETDPAQPDPVRIFAIGPDLWTVRYMARHKNHTATYTSSTIRFVGRAGSGGCHPEVEDRPMGTKELRRAAV